MPSCSFPFIPGRPPLPFFPSGPTSHEILFSFIHPIFFSCFFIPFTVSSIYWFLLCTRNFFFHWFFLSLLIWLILTFPIRRLFPFLLACPTVQIAFHSQQQICSLPSQQSSLRKHALRSFPNILCKMEFVFIGSQKRIISNRSPDEV